MNFPRSARIILCLLALTLVSGLAGGLIGHRVARRQLEARNDPENWNEHVIQEFDRIVQPTAEQAPKIQAHLDRAVQDLVAIRSETVARTTNVIWRLVAEVDQELTPKQREAFTVMKPKPGELGLEMLKVKPKANAK